jgi:hypothetical protein
LGLFFGLATTFTKKEKEKKNKSKNRSIQPLFAQTIGVMQ